MISQIHNLIYGIFFKNSAAGFKTLGRRTEFLAYSSEQLFTSYSVQYKYSGMIPLKISYR